MRAVLQTDYQDDVRAALTWSSTFAIPEPDGKTTHVRVRVSHAATNPIDPKFANGDYAALLKHTFPCPVGRDFSGWVDKITEGPNVPNPQGIKVGDRVCGFLDHEQLAQGAMAEYVCCPMKILAVVPPEVPLRIAAGIPLHAITTYVAMMDHCKS
jgi:NADPH:quinone reductase-like Zn-dependent oxidoreductase